MKFFGKLIGKEAIQAAFERAGDAIERNLIKNVQETTLDVHRNAIMLVQRNSGGTPDIRYNPKRAVTVSKPGNPPNTDTGTLVKSIAFDFEFSKGKFVGKVGTNLKYGAWLEFGTQKMAARPWLAPALRAQQKFYINRFKEDLKKVAREVARQKKGAKE